MEKIKKALLMVIPSTFSFLPFYWSIIYFLLSILFIHPSLYPFLLSHHSFHPLYFLIHLSIHPSICLPIPSFCFNLPFNCFHPLGHFLLCLASFYIFIHPSFYPIGFFIPLFVLLPYSFFSFFPWLHWWIHPSILCSIAIIQFTKIVFMYIVESQ